MISHVAFMTACRSCLGVRDAWLTGKAGAELLRPAPNDLLRTLYLSCDHWFRNGQLKNATVEFHNAGGVLFGVKEYVPALMVYIKKYGDKYRRDQ
jgi:hypothetical protein